MTRAEAWPPEQDATISRLAFLAARADLRRMARPWWLGLLRGAEVYGGPYAGRSVLTAAARDRDPEAWSRVQPPTMAKEISAGRMSAYVVACDRVSARLSVDERRALRERGALPEWFLPEVKRVARQIRRRGPAAA